MAGAWGDAWAGAWGAAWGDAATDPNALRGTGAGIATAQATVTAIAWLSGSSAGSSTAQAYLELDGGTIPSPAVVGSSRPVRAPYRPREEDEALLLFILR